MSDNGYGGREVKPYYSDDVVTLHHGDCIEVMRGLPDASVDAIVTDPPYGLGFMGRGWDDLPPGLDFAVEALRVLKPGGYLLAFGGSRTWHRLAVAVEDAGFEIRDSIAWLYGSGFPKSLNVSKAIDKAAGALAHESVGFTVAGRTDRNLPNPVVKGYTPPAPATPDAERWQGWGTALKPAFEPIVVGRKPLVGTVAGNVLAYGTGALNIDGCRVGETGATKRSGHSTHLSPSGAFTTGHAIAEVAAGRWPTNVVLDDSQATELDRQSGVSVSKSGGSSGTHFSAGEPGVPPPERPRGGHDDSGGASRFFPTFRYQAKAPRSERPNVDGTVHPTVKPLALMRWLVRLVTPPGGVVLEPFAGSGTTLEAALVEGFSVIGIEREADYLPLIMSRLQKPIEQTPFGGDAA